MKRLFLCLIAILTMIWGTEAVANSLSLKTYKRLQKIEEWIANDQLSEAETTLKEMLADLPQRKEDQAYILYTAGMFSLQQSDYPTAQKHLLASYQLKTLPEKTSHYVLQTLAGLSMQEERYSEAVDYYQSYIQQVETPETSIYLGLGTAYYYQKAYTETVEALDKALDPKKPNESVYLMRYSAFYELQQSDQIFATLKILIQHWPEKQNYWSQLASFYYEADQPDQAILTLKEMVQRWPEKQTFWVQLSSLYNEQEDYRSSLKVLRQALAHKALKERDRLEPRILRILRTLAGLSMHDERYQEAIDYYQDYIKRAKTPPFEIYFELGSAYYTIDDHSKAAATLEKAIDPAAPNESAFLMLFSSYYESNQSESAINTLKRMVQHWPEKPNYWHQLASVYYEANQVERAIATLETMVEKWPDNPNYWLQLASFQSERQDYVSALNTLQTAIAHEAIVEKSLLEESRLQVLQTLAGINMQAEDYAEAINYYQMILTYHSEPDLDLYFNLGTAYYYQQSYSQAVTYLEKANDPAEPNESLYLLLLASHIELKQWEPVVTTLETMVQRWPQEPEYWLQLSGLYSEQADFLTALEVLENAVSQKGLSQHEELVQNLLDVLLTLADLSLKEERYAAAIGYYQSYLKRNQKPDAQVYLGLGMAYYYQQDYPKATQTLNQVIESSEPEEATYMMLFSAYYEVKDWDRAIATLDTIIRYWPDNPDYWLQMIALYNEKADYPKALEMMQAAWTRNYLNQEEDVLQYIYTLQEEQLPYKAALVLEQGFEQSFVPKTSENYELLSQLYQDAKETGRAIEALKPAATTSTNGNNDLLLAQLYFDLENAHEQVILHAKRATEKGGEHTGNAYLLLAIAYSELGQNAEAKPYFEQAARYPEVQEMSLQWLESLQF